MRIRWILLLPLFSLVFTGCGGSAPLDQAPQNPQGLPTAEISPNPLENPLQFASTPETIEMPSNPPAPEKFVSLSKKDLAAYLQIDAEKIALVEATAILWPDAALGCPSPGKVYAQGRVPGYLIKLEVEGKEYSYHTDFKGQVILCSIQDPDNPDAFGPTTTGPTPNIGVPID